MKMKMDLVTNSSSCSFVLAYDGSPLTAKQKDVIANYVVKKMLGNNVFEPGTTREEIIEKFDGEEPENFEDIMASLKKGKTVMVGDIDCHDDVIEPYLSLYKDLWRELNGVDGFEVVDGYLGF